jgi:hypothetical protein
MFIAIMQSVIISYNQINLYMTTNTQLFITYASNRLKKLDVLRYAATGVPRWDRLAG